MQIPSVSSGINALVLCEGSREQTRAKTSCAGLGYRGTEKKVFTPLESGMQPMKKAFVLVNTDLGSETEVMSELEKVKGIARVYEVYGVYDVVVEVEVEMGMEFELPQPTRSTRAAKTFAMTAILPATWILAPRPGWQDLRYWSA